MICGLCKEPTIVGHTTSLACVAALQNHVAILETGNEVDRALASELQARIGRLKDWADSAILQMRQLEDFVRRWNDDLQSTLNAAKL